MKLISGNVNSIIENLKVEKPIKGLYFHLSTTPTTYADFDTNLIEVSVDIVNSETSEEIPLVKRISLRKLAEISANGVGYYISDSVTGTWCEVTLGLDGIRLGNNRYLSITVFNASTVSEIWGVESSTYVDKAFEYSKLFFEADKTEVLVSIGDYKEIFVPSNGIFKARIKYKTGVTVVKSVEEIEHEQRKQNDIIRMTSAAGGSITYGYDKLFRMNVDGVESIEFEKNSFSIEVILIKEFQD